MRLEISIELSAEEVPLATEIINALRCAVGGEGKGGKRGSKIKGG